MVHLKDFKDLMCKTPSLTTQLACGAMYISPNKLFISAKEFYRDLI